MELKNPKTIIFLILSFCLIFSLLIMSLPGTFIRDLLTIFAKIPSGQFIKLLCVEISPFEYAPRKARFNAERIKLEFKSNWFIFFL